MTDTPNRPPLWQVLAPILDESILQSLRDMDDPDAERDLHDAERIADYVDTVMDLANWLVPEEPEAPVGDSEPWPLPYQHRGVPMWEQRQLLRALLTTEADRAGRGDHG